VTFELLRTTPVNVLRYLPDFLSKDPVFKLQQDTLSWEHEKARLEIIDITKQLFASSATWGLDDWERIYNLSYGSDDTYDYRRNKLLEKIRGARTSTVEAMNQIVQTYGSGYVEEHNALNYFNVYTTCKDSAMLQEMRKQILTYKPAHLGTNIYTGYSWNGHINFDGTYTYGSSNTEWSDE
jgi:hypothetical protein